MFKKWLAILGAVVLLVCTSQLLWGGNGDDDGEEYPWEQNSGGGGTGHTGGTGNASAQSNSSSPLKRIFIVRPAPMGGFYIMRIDLPSGASTKRTADGKKVGN